MKDLKKSYRIDVYGYTVHVVVSEDFNTSVKKYCKGLDEDFNTANGLFIHDNKKEFQGYIFVRPESPTSTVAHESFHAACRIMFNIGSELADESEEPYAYLVGHITNLVVKTLLIWDKKYPAIEGIETEIPSIENN